MLGAAPAALGRLPSAELTTYGYGPARDGASPTAVGISSRQAPRLRIAWGANLDGAINGQALIVNGVRLRRRAHGRLLTRVRDIALLATEHGEIAALRVSSGRRIWSRHVGSHGISPACQASPDARFGVTGTMVADKAHNRVYAVDVNGKAWAFDLRTGHLIHGWPVRVHPRGGDFVWSALALSRGWLYVPIASLCDRGRYYGGVKAINVAHPRIIRRWLTTAGTHAWAGGIWGWGGISIDARTGDVFGATGNSLPSPETAGYAERLVRLSPLLKLEQSNYPLRPPFQTSDRDFGTTPVLIKARGCPLQAIAINKDGNLYRYNADDIDNGPRQRIAVASGAARFIPLYGVPAYDPHSRRLVLTSPSTAPGGSQRAGIQTFIFTRKCRLVPSWQRGFDPPSAGSPPTIAQGVLYISSGRDAILRIYRLSDGHELSAHKLWATSFSAPAVADRTVIVGDWRGHVWAFRPK